MAAVPLRATKSSFMSERLDSYFAKIAKQVGNDGGREKKRQREREEDVGAREREFY